MRRSKSARLALSRETVITISATTTQESNETLR